MAASSVGLSVEHAVANTVTEKERLSVTFSTSEEGNRLNRSHELIFRSMT